MVKQKEKLNKEIKRVEVKNIDKFIPKSSGEIKKANYDKFFVKSEDEKKEEARLEV